MEDNLPTSIHNSLTDKSQSRPSDEDSDMEDAEVSQEIVASGYVRPEMNSTPTLTNRSREVLRRKKANLKIKKTQLGFVQRKRLQKQLMDLTRVVSRLKTPESQLPTSTGKGLVSDVKNSNTLAQSEKTTTLPQADENTNKETTEKQNEELYNFVQNWFIL